MDRQEQDAPDFSSKTDPVRGEWACIGAYDGALWGVAHTRGTANASDVLEVGGKMLLYPREDARRIRDLLNSLHSVSP